MEITEVRVRVVQDVNDRLKAVCTITLDDAFVVRDVKVVEGLHGLFVAMPSRKLSVPCARCRTQNHLRAKHCNECGHKLPSGRIPTDDDGREKVHRDVAHPITSSFRRTLQDRVLEAYHNECERQDDAAPADDTERVPESISEYDSLIADLNGGDRSRRRKKHHETVPARKERPAAHDRGDRTDKPTYTHADEGKESLPSEPVRRDVVEPAITPISAKEESLESTSGGSSEGGDDTFGAGFLDTPMSEPRDERSDEVSRQAGGTGGYESTTEQKPVPEQSKPDSCGDEETFGAGLL